MKRIMRAFKLDEISAVDRPAQEGARMVLLKRADTERPDDKESQDNAEKRDFDAAQRRSAASDGAALPDGSFPIKNKEDLANARRLVGHAKDKAAAEAHIRTRAKALGVSLDKQEVLTMDITSEDLTKMISDGVTEALAKQAEDAAKAAEAEKAKQKDKGDSKDPDENTEDGNKTKKSFTYEDLPDEMKKSLDAAAADRVVLKQLLEDKEVLAYEKRATALGLDSLHGEVLRKAYSGDKGGIEEMEKLLKGLSAQVRTGKVFSEFGSNQAGGANTATAEIHQKASAYKQGQEAVGKRCSESQAFTKVYLDPVNADLKKRYDNEELRDRAKKASAVGL